MKNKGATGVRRPVAFRLWPKQVAVLVAAAGILSFSAVVTAVPLLELHPADRGNWLPVAAGGAVAVVWPLLAVWAMRRAGAFSRWPWMLLGSWGVAIIISLGTVPGRRGQLPPLAQPPRTPLLLAVQAFTSAGIAVLVLAMLGLLALPWMVRRHRRQRLARQAAWPAAGQPDIQTRLRLEAPGAAGKWQRGTLHVGAGSLLWRPATGAGGQPLELAAATSVAPGPAPRSPRAARNQARILRLDVPAGRVQLLLDPATFRAAQAAAVGQPGGGSGGRRPGRGRQNSAT